MNVGANIHRIREEKGIAQARLAEQAQVSQSMLCQIERGTKLPSLPLGAELARLLGCELQELLQ